MRSFYRADIILIATIAIAAASAARADDKFFDSDGVKIRYTDDGQGPPVVLIHGFMATGDMNWRVNGVVKELLKNYRVITLDNRGHGKSDKPTEAAEYGEKMAQDAIRLLDHLKIKQAHFVGYSMGGMITLKVAAVAPERMLSGVVGGMGWTPLGPAVKEREGAEGRNPSMRACARAFPQLGITREQLLAIKVPLTVVIGKDDSLLNRSVEPLREARPDIPVVEIDGANHITCVLRPELRQAIVAFLDKQREAAPERSN
jgi:pimeloyl-ACP methyl ester carboxylesterase